MATLLRLIDINKWKKNHNNCLKNRAMSFLPKQLVHSNYQGWRLSTSSYLHFLTYLVNFLNWKWVFLLFFMLLVLSLLVDFCVIFKFGCNSISVCLFFYYIFWTIFFISSSFLYSSPSWLFVLTENFFKLLLDPRLTGISMFYKMLSCSKFEHLLALVLISLFLYLQKLWVCVFFYICLYF